MVPVEVNEILAEVLFLRKETNKNMQATNSYKVEVRLILFAKYGLFCNNLLTLVNQRAVLVLVSANNVVIRLLNRSISAK